MTNSIHGRDPNTRPRIVLVNRCFVIDSANKKLLLLKRSSQNRYMPGTWEAPGGKLDEMQDISHALEREVMEETGLLVESTERLVFAHSEIIDNGPYRGLPYILLFSIGKMIGGKLIISDEHDEFVWVTYNEALDYNLGPNIRKALIVLEQHLKKYLE